MWSLLLLACNPELREAERRQKALQSEIDDLRSEVAVLKRAVGKPAGRKKSGKRKHPDSSSDTRTPVPLRLDLTRTGPLPTLTTPPHEPAEGACGHRLRVPELKRISDYQLTTRKLGKSSPLRLAVNGSPLPAHAFPKDYQACNGAFRHAGTVVLFSTPSEGPPTGLTLSLAADFPSPRADGRPMHWLHSGQTVRLITGAWSPDWGTPRLVVQIDGPHEITVDGKSGAALTGTGPWRIEISTDEHALIDRLQIQSPTHVAVVTSPESWKAR